MNREGHVWNGFEYVSPDKFQFDTANIPVTDRTIEVREVPVEIPIHPTAPMRERPQERVAALSTEVLFEEILSRIERNEGGLREGLQETPKRVVKAFRHWFSGYDVDVAKLLKVFEDGAENYDQMVTVKDIPIYSKCEHHMADIFGTATIAYIPNGKIVGLSKLSRLADAFARRLQVQERLTAQIADALEKHLQPKGVGVMIKARHMCMESRGICQQGHHTVTTALRGVLLSENSARSEFMALAR
jgi:GTP cyclohydrolase I